MDIYTSSKVVETAPLIIGSGIGAWLIGVNVYTFISTMKDLKKYPHETIEWAHKKEMSIIGKLGYPGRKLAYLIKGEI